MTDPAKKFEALAAECEEAFRTGERERLRAALSALETTFPPGAQVSRDIKALFAGLLIDAGAVVGDESAIRRGQEIFRNNWELLRPIYGDAQLYYNIGNSYKSLYDVERLAPNWHFNLESTKSLFEAKSNYWRALAAGDATAPAPEQLTNLANTLNSCGRVVDALHYYDRALLSSPRFEMAHANRALALRYLNRVTGVWSVKLLYEIYQSSDIASTSAAIDIRARQSAEHLAEMTASVLREHGYNPTEDPDSRLQTQEEYRRHDFYWRWCLGQSLSLSEHSLYCSCAGARRDDLSILTSGSALGGEKVPLMEMFLNRVKSEYCLARALLFQSITQRDALDWRVEPFEGTFTELLESEDIGIKAEFLRTSFRLCFGILDRIARAICVMFGIATEQDKIYFDSFWRPPGKKGQQRWATLNGSENPSLVALYGLARDLNERSGGEWGRLKRYRNMFEHEFLLVREGFAQPEQPILIGAESVPSISRSEMSADALQMLRFTRAAILYFAFFVRWESRPADECSTRDIITLPKKELGKG